MVSPPASLDFSYQLDDQPPSAWANQPQSGHYDGLAEGWHDFQVWVRDPDLLTSTDSLSFAVDFTDPETPVTTVS